MSYILALYKRKRNSWDTFLFNKFENYIVEKGKLYVFGPTYNLKDKSITRYNLRKIKLVYINIWVQSKKKYKKLHFFGS